MRGGRGSSQLYDVPAEGYEELYGREQEEKYMEIFRRIGVKNGWRVLDVGCGILLLLRFLRKIGFRGLYVGMDIDEERLRYGKKYLDPMSDIVVADAHKPPFRPKTFHISTIITVIHLLRLDALREIADKTEAIMVTTLLKKRMDLGEALEEILGMLGKTLRLQSGGSDEIYLTMLETGSLKCRMEGLG